jgi:hypothetical protein
LLEEHLGTYLPVSPFKMPQVARIRCYACGTEGALAFSCMERKFYPSCGQRRSVEFRE